MIYLSLNETNVVMKHLSRVPERFQKNPHICRARRVISAFMLGNYSVFWHEVKKCTILEASALHRYFNQVRRQAIVKIKSAYSPTDLLDADFFCKRLFLNDGVEVEEYLGSHGVFPNEEGLYSIKDRVEFFFLFCRKHYDF